jgi:hypothetical protein
MTDQEDTQATEPTTADRAEQKAREAGHGAGRDDSAPGTPAPDPTADASDAEDVPDAD